jgi:hypothetical protein
MKMLNRRATQRMRWSGRDHHQITGQCSDLFSPRARAGASEWRVGSFRSQLEEDKGFQRVVDETSEAAASNAPAPEVFPIETAGLRQPKPRNGQYRRSVT